MFTRYNLMLYIETQVTEIDIIHTEYDIRTEFSNYVNVS